MLLALSKFIFSRTYSCLWTVNLQMSKIGLTETVKGDPKKFEVWLEGRQEIYTIQATTVDQRDLWVKEIKKVLFEQLAELKGEKLRQYAEKW